MQIDDSSNDSDDTYLTRIRDSTGRKFYVCKECGLRFKSKSGIKRHFEKKHMVKQDDDNKKVDKGNFVCPKCGQLYTRTDTFRRHTRYECGVPRKFECQICSLRFKRQNHLTRHMDTHLKHLKSDLS